MEYRSTSPPSTNKSPSQLLMVKDIKLKVPNIDTIHVRKSDNAELWERDAKEMSQQRDYDDKRHGAASKQIQVGENVVMKQKKSITKPPYDQTPYMVTEVSDTKLHLFRDGRTMVCNMDKCKLVKIKQSKSPSKKMCLPGEEKGYPKKTTSNFPGFLLPNSNNISRLRMMKKPTQPHGDTIQDQIQKTINKRMQETVN